MIDKTRARRAFIVTHNLFLPHFGDGKIIDKEVSPVRLGNDRGADDVLMCAQETYFVYGITITNLEIVSYILFGCETVPKFPIAAELQALQDNVLASVIECCIRRLHYFVPRLFGRGHFLKVFNLELLFAVFKIFVYTLEVLRLMRYNGNGCVLVPWKLWLRHSHFVLVILVNLVSPPFEGRKNSPLFKDCLSRFDTPSNCKPRERRNY